MQSNNTHTIHMNRSFPYLKRKSNVSAIPKSYTSEEYLESENSIWKKMVIGIVTCDMHESRFNNFMSIFKDTIDKLGIQYYIIKSNPDLDTDQDYLIDGNYFYVKAEESYEKLVHKVMVFLSYVELETDYEYIVKTDDGCLLNFPLMIKNLHLDFIGSPRIARDRKNHWGKCKDPELNRWISDFKHDLDMVIGTEAFNRLNLAQAPYGGGGNGYRLTRKALTGISKYLDHAKTLKFAYEDLFIGQIMRIHGIKFTKQEFGGYHKIPN